MFIRLSDQLRLLRAVLVWVGVLHLAGITFSQTVIVASDYPSIPDAVDDCPTNGCTVLVASGVHIISRPIQLRSRIRILGQPGSVVEPAPEYYGPLVRADGSFTNYATLGRNVSAGSNEIHFDSLETALVSPDSIRSDIGSGSLLRIGVGNELDEFEGQIALVRSVNENGIELALPTGVRIPQNANLGVISPVQEAEIEDLTFQNARDWTMYLHGTQRLTLKNVTITGGYGIWCTHSHRPTFDRVKLSNLYYAIRMFAGLEARFIRCQLTDIIGPNFGLIYTNHTILESCTVRASHTQLAQGFSGDGISLSASSYNIVRNNEVRDVSCYGMWLTHGGFQNMISGNTVSGSFTAGIRVQDNSSCTILDNRIEDIGRSAGVFLYRAERTVVADNIMNRCDRPLHIELSTRSTILDNSGIDNALPPNILPGLGEDDTMLRNHWAIIN